MIRAPMPPWLRRAAIVLLSTCFYPGLLCAASLPLQVHLQLLPCLASEEKEVRRFLRIELDAELLPADALPPPGVPRAQLSCESEAILIRIEDPITGKTLERRLSLRTAATTRARLLALALTELLLASWAELTLAPIRTQETPTAPSQGSDEVPAAVASVPPTLPSRLAATELVRKHRQDPSLAPLQIGLQGVFLSFPLSAASSLLGGALRLAGDLRYRMHWQFELHGHYGTSEVAVGSLRSALFAVAVALHYEQTLGATRLRFGGGFRVGAAWLRGQPQDDRQFVGLDLWGPFAGPMLRVAGARLLPRRLIVDVAAEVGYAPVAVRGNIDGDRGLSIEGPWVSVQLGLGRRL